MKKIKYTIIYIAGLLVFSLSIVTVFVLMPGLLMSFSKLIDKSHHRSFVPEITPWINGVVKSRYVLPCIFGVVVTAAIILSYHCPYAYSETNLKTIAKNDMRIAREMIDDTFSDSNMLAVLVPSGSYEKEKSLKEVIHYEKICLSRRKTVSTGKPAPAVCHLPVH